MRPAEFKVSHPLKITLSVIRRLSSFLCAPCGNSAWVAQSLQYFQGMWNMDCYGMSQHKEAAFSNIVAAAASDLLQASLPKATESS